MSRPLPESTSAAAAFGPPTSVFQRARERWVRFWFAPQDPTVLGFIRIGAGLLALYSLLSYSFDLQEFFGENAWYTYEARRDFIHNAPVLAPPMTWGYPGDAPEPRTKWEKDYRERYINAHHQPPPGPYPRDQAAADLYEKYHKDWGIDPRMPQLGGVLLPLPENDFQKKYVPRYIRKHGALPPPPYPNDEAEEDEIEAYMAHWGFDPRVCSAKGMVVWSVWFHVTDPFWMAMVHLCTMVIVLLFTLGFCTRITSVLTWIAMIGYIQRSPTTLFGADTMLNILLIYLMIAPCGAALSLDRVLARWWAGARPRVIGRWRAFWDKWLRREPSPVPIAAGEPPPLRPEPLVSAGVAIRLLQIHVCFVYLAAGLAKLQGTTWWNGTAVWGTLTNYEFAPMSFGPYMDVIRLVSKNRMLLEIVLTSGSVFTLIFEICFAFLIWHRGTRWIMLIMAVMLHTFIAVFMGLVTFAIVMLVMDLVFLKPTEVRWPLDLLSRLRRWISGPPAEPPPTREAARLHPAPETAAIGATQHIKQRK